MKLEEKLFSFTKTMEKNDEIKKYPFNPSELGYYP